ncbi:hypothetical protein F0U59_18500 [Archangium gephyra]|nr:hypothetical protein F0U59_18500 [Archangium gephyra]
MTSLTRHPQVEALRSTRSPEWERFLLMRRWLAAMPLEELRHLVQCVRRFEDAEAQFRATRELSSRVPAESLLPLVDAVLHREVPGLERVRDETLRALRSVLDPVQWDESFGRVHGQAPDSHARRLDFLLTLSRRGLGKQARQPFLERALWVAEHTPLDVRHTLKVNELVAELMAPARSRVRPLLASLPPSAARGSAVLAWAQTMSRQSKPELEDFSWALDELWDFSASGAGSPGERVEALAWVAHLLSSEDVPIALSHVRAREDQRLRMPLQMALASRLPVARRRSLVEQSLGWFEETVSSGEDDVHAVLLRYLPLPLIDRAWTSVLGLDKRPTPELLGTLLRRSRQGVQPRNWMWLLERASAWTEDEPWPWLSSLWRGLRPGVRDQVVEQLDLLDDAETRARGLAALSGATRYREERTRLRDRALNASAAIASPQARERFVAEFSAQEQAPLPFPTPLEVGAPVARVEARPSPPLSFPVGDPLLTPMGQTPRVDPASLLHLSEEERNSLLREMVRALDGAPSTQEINLGFCERSAPSRTFPQNRCLRPAREYLLWFELGGTLEDSISREPTFLDTSQMPEDAVLSVALFAFEEELELVPEQSLGQVRLSPTGRTQVVHQPGDIHEEHLPGRLFFPVRTPAKPGTYRLRCNIHHEATLLQSWLVRVEVREGREDVPDALWAMPDFVYARVLSPAQLHQLPSPDLTLMLNGTEASSHVFIFGEGTQQPISFGTAELKKLVNTGRDRLAKATWGTPRPWTEGSRYRYGEGMDPARLLGDLIELARVGWRFYSMLSGRLPFEKKKELRELFAQPRSLLLALKESPQAVFPLALVYDHNIDTEWPAERFTLCPHVLEALENAQPLSEVACFLSGCEFRGRGGPTNVICPSGFWGFRHELGLALSMPHLREAPTHIPYADPRHVAVGLSTDERLTHREAHVDTLRTQHTAAHWRCEESREEVLTLLKTTQPHLVYFYCNGGVTEDDSPFIQVGPCDERGITRDNLDTYEIEWGETRPLVFINGCYTTALEPEIALNLVAGFLETAQASGVLGTEITVFEDTARDFAEHCLEGLFKGDTVGRAVRDARRALLQRGNPLGLVYIPFVLPGLRFAPSPLSSALRTAAPEPVPA